MEIREQFVIIRVKRTTKSPLLERETRPFSPKIKLHIFTLLFMSLTLMTV